MASEGGAAGRLLVWALHWLYRILLVLAGASAFWIWHTRDELDARTRFGIGIPFMAVFAGSALFFRSRYHRAGRAQDARVAAGIMRALEGGGESGVKFVLYLRPFDLAGKVLARNPSHSPTIMTPGYFEPEFIDMEAVLAKVFSRVGPLVGLGDPGQTAEVAARERGAGLFLVRSGRWQEKLLLLAEHALLILVIPWDSESCLWEMEAVLGAGFLEKTVFLLPREMVEGVRSQPPYLDGDRWRSIRDAYGRQPLGLAVPTSIENGAIFALETGGELKSAAAAFSLDSVYQARRALRSCHPATKNF